MSEYRTTDYTIFNLCNKPDHSNYKQCEVAWGNESKRVWVDNIHLDKALTDVFLEFKTPDGEWEGIPWRILNIGPTLTDQAIGELHANIILLDKDDVRDYKRWNP